MVLLTGEAGIGKTRVLGEVAAEAAVAGGRVLVGRFHETEQVLPFQAWIDALRGGDVLASLDRSSPAAREVSVRERVENC
jgi:predicted ATPase